MGTGSEEGPALHPYWPSEKTQSLTVVRRLSAAAAVDLGGQSWPKSLRKRAKNTSPQFISRASGGQDVAAGKPGSNSRRVQAGGYKEPGY